MGTTIAIENTNFQFQTRSQLITREIKSLLSLSEWNLTWGAYEKCKMKEVAYHMQKTKVQKIIAWKNNNQCILKDFSHIQFCKLKVIDLSANCILNIQAVSWAYAPNLQVLALNDNNICSAKPLSKLNAQKLKSINLKGNKIIQSKMMRGRFGPNFDGQLLLDMQRFRYNERQNNSIKNYIISDMNLLFKMNIFELKKLNIGSSIRIKQKYIIQCVQRNWQNIQFRQRCKKN